MEKERAQPSIPVIILALQQQHSGSIGCWLLYNMTKGPAPRYDNYYVDLTSILRQLSFTVLPKCVRRWVFRSLIHVTP